MKKFLLLCGIVTALSLFAPQTHAYQQDCLASLVTPTWNEQQSVPCSVRLDGGMGVHFLDQLGGEHVDADETLGYLRVVGGLARSFSLMTDVLVDGSSTPITLPIGSKTFFSEIVGSAGAQSATITIWGDYKSTATEEFLICTMSLTGTSEDAKKCDAITHDFDFYHAKIASISGTDATINVWANVGLGSAGGSAGGGGGDASEAEQQAQTALLTTIDADTSNLSAMLTALQLIDNIVSGSGANISQINGVTPLMGAGPSGTGAQRTTESDDSPMSAGIGTTADAAAGVGGTGSINAKLRVITTQLNTIGSANGTEDAAETAGGVLRMMGSVRRDVAATSSGATGENSTVNTDALGLLWSRTLDPCSGVAKTVIPFLISTATTTELTASLAGASNNYYVCSINVGPVAGAQNFALVDDDSDGCGSVTSGLAGGTTAANGWNFGANGGIALGNGESSIAKTNGTNRVICAVTSAAVVTPGVLTVVAAP